MFNKLFGFSTMLLLSALLLLTSCERDLLSDIGNGDSTQAAKNDDIEGFEGRTGPMGKSKCFDLIFPVTLLDTEGETVGEAISQEELKNIVTEYKQAEGCKAKLQIVLPYDVILEDGTLQTVASEEDRAELKQACADMGFGKDKGHKPHLGFKCYTVNFPVSFTLPDESTISVESKEDAKEQLTAWKEANPGAVGHPKLNFPILLIKDDGTEVTINSHEELKDLRGTCEEEA